MEIFYWKYILFSVLDWTLRHKEFHLLLRHHGASQLRVAPSEPEIEELHEDSTPEQPLYTRDSESFQNDTFHTFEPTSNNVFPSIVPNLSESIFLGILALVAVVAIFGLTSMVMTFLAANFYAFSIR